MSGNLYVVATPIGNLEDLTPRARQTLAEVDLIAAEDTRHTGRLLSHIGVKTPLLALHDHNEEEVVPRVIAALEKGQSVALVSDAGTPLVSDPGFRLVRAAHQGEITVSPIPGASALTAALSAAGLPTDRFCFEGFPPSKRAARRAWLEALSHEERTIVLYESVHRIHDCLEDLAQVFGGLTGDRWDRSRAAPVSSVTSLAGRTQHGGPAEIRGMADRHEQQARCKHKNDVEKSDRDLHCRNPRSE